MTSSVKIAAILFDMDGVLVNAKPWHYQALNQALSDFGYDPIPYDVHLSDFDGLPTRQKLQRYHLNRPIAEEDFEAINQRKQHFTHQIAQQSCRYAPQLVDMCQKLIAQGYQLAVCSNSVRLSVDGMMQQTGLAPFMNFTLSNEDVAQPKPSPEIYLKAMDMLHLTPAQCLIVEDNHNGIKAAKASGGHVMVIDDQTNVTYDAIMQHLNWL